MRSPHKLIQVIFDNRPKQDDSKKHQTTEIIANHITDELNDSY